MQSTLQGIKSFFQKPEFGLLVIRASVGAIMAIAGYNKFAAGTQTLNWVGANIQHVGLSVGSDNAMTLFFGIMAAGSELLGGLLLLVGFFHRTAAAFLVFTMLVATLMKINTGGGLSDFGYPMIMGLTLLGLIFTGPGRISLQKE